MVLVNLRLLIRNRKLRCFEGDYDVQELKFWADNPRIYSSIHKETETH